MRVNIFYDDEFVDIIDVPENIGELEKIQGDFLKWLFDKENDHKYWVILDGEKKYCSYGTDALIEWINNTILVNSVLKAKVYKSSTNCYAKYNPALYF